jgi:hypothetical protein
LASAGKYFTRQQARRCGKFSAENAAEQRQNGRENNEIREFNAAWAHEVCGYGRTN